MQKGEGRGLTLMVVVVVVMCSWKNVEVVRCTIFRVA